MANKKTTPTTSNITFPYDKDIEQRVIGAILLQHELMEDASTMLTPNSFYDSQLRKVYEKMLKLYNQNQSINYTDVASAFRAEHDDAAFFCVVDTFSNSTSTYNFEYYVKVLRQLQMKRDLIVLGDTTMQMAQDLSVDVADVLETTEKSLTDLQVNISNDTYTMEEAINDFFEDLSSKDEQPISTGLTELNRILCGGFHSPDLIILGGRPSMGKTQFAVHFTEQAALQGKHVFFVSIEQTRKQIVARMAAKGVSYSDMRNKSLSVEDWKTLDSVAAKMLKYPITIADNPDCRNLNNIKSTARKLKRKGEIDMMVIDYLQLIRTNQHFEKRYIEVGYITGELKNLAKELNIPIILLAQLSRPPKGSEGELPKMEDLRESGDIEQDADVIIFPHRPSYYDSMASDSNGRSWENRGVLLVAKNREGERNAKALFANDKSFKQFFDDTAIEVNNYIEKDEPIYEPIF